MSRELNMKLDSGHKVQFMDTSEEEDYKKDFNGYEGNIVRLIPGRWLFPERFLDFANGIYNFEFRESDVVLMTWPKCGTTWTQEMLWTMRNNPDLNNPLGKRDLYSRCPYIDYDMMILSSNADPSEFKRNADPFLELCPGKDPKKGIFLEYSKAIPDPRTFKTHLSFSLLPMNMLDTIKVVYVARDPRDVIVSYHHHHRFSPKLDYLGLFKDFVQYFVDDSLLYGPYWRHLMEAWEKRNHPNLHIIFYEDLKANPLEEIKKLNAFINTNLTEEQMQNIVKYTSFEEMKSRVEKSMAMEPKNEKREIVNKDAKRRKEYVKKKGGFFRKGVVGDWKNKFTPELEAKVNKWTQVNLGHLGGDFRYVIK